MGIKKMILLMRFIAPGYRFPDKMSEVPLLGKFKTIQYIVGITYKQNIFRSTLSGKIAGLLFIIGM